jgi:hypothetical protein
MGKTVFDDFFSSQWGLVLKDYSENIELTFNRDLRRTIDSLFYMDQFFRKNRVNIAYHDNGSRNYTSLIQTRDRLVDVKFSSLFGVGPA